MSKKAVLTSSSTRTGQRLVIFLLFSSVTCFVLLSFGAGKSSSRLARPESGGGKAFEARTFPPIAMALEGRSRIANSPPTAVDDSYTVHRSLRTSSSVPPYGVLRNDSDPDGDNIACESKFVVTAHGSASVSSDGNVGYDPASDFVGTESITYTVCDSHGGCSNATITFNVVNQAPTVVDDSYKVHGFFQTNPSGPPLGVLHNDSDLDGDSYACEVINNLITPYGSASVTSGGDVTYSPAAGFVGSDVINYRVCDSLGACGNGTITFNVVNQPPTVIDDFYVVRGQSFDTAASLPPNGALNNDSDPDGDNIATVRKNHVRTAHGYVTLDGFGRVSYSPDPGFVGTDSTSYEAGDNLEAFGSGTIWFFVLGGGENNGPLPCGSVGRPVNVTNGNMYLQQADYRLPGIGNGLEVIRSYNSDFQRTGLFGRGWSTAYDEAIKVYDSNLLRLDLPEGRSIYFGRGNSAGFTPLSPEFYGHITQNGAEGYTLSFKDGRVHQFDTSGRLLVGIDRNRNRTTLTYGPAGKLDSVTDASGRVLNVTTDSEGRVISIEDSLGTIATYAYGGDGALRSVTYPGGPRFDFSYSVLDSRLLLRTVKDGLGNVTEAHDYDESGRATTSETAGGVERYHLNFVGNGETHVTDALGRVTRYFFDSSKGRNAVTRTEGPCNCGGGSSSSFQTWTHDAQLNVLTRSNALNQMTAYTYDTNGNLLTELDVLGTTVYTYNQLGQILTETDTLGAVTTYTYDERGNLLSVQNALNQTANFSYDSRGLLIKVTDARSKMTSFTYDASGNLVAATNAAGHPVRFAYDGRGRLTSATDVIGHVTRYEYDAVGRLIKITGPNDAATTFTYDGAGRRTSATDARGNSTHYAYDNAGRMVTRTDALGGTITFEYDLMSNLTGSTDAAGRSTNFGYDEFNRPAKVVYPPTAPGATRLEERIEYDAVGNVKKRIDSAGRETLYEYDAANRPVKVRGPGMQDTRYEYNAVSEITAVNDALDQRYEFVYDKVGRRTRMLRGGQSMPFSYDAAGNLKRRKDYNGAVTTYRHDALNRLTRIEYPDATTATYSYDRLGRLRSATNQQGTVSFAYNKVNLLTNVTDVFGQELDYNYDMNGNRTKVSLNASAIATYRYDALNRPIKLTDESGAATTFAYDATGQLTSRRLPNGVTTSYQYDGMNRMTRLRAIKGANAISDNQYLYNASSQITQLLDLGGSHLYGYDSAGRLTSATYPNTAPESYVYDAVGNRTASHLSASYTYQPFNRLTQTGSATYGYDNNGNLITRTDASGTWAYQWDFENRLARVIRSDGRDVNYRYDGLGRRIQRISATGSSTNFTYDGADVVLDQSSDGAAVRYLNGPGIDNKLRQTSNAGTSYFIQDHLGSTRALTNGAGNVVARFEYDAFGNGGINVPTRYGFTGRELDADIGLYYYRARWYDHQTGRFVSEDPAGFAGGLNMYTYVSGNPISKRDPLGLYEKDVHFYLTYYLALRHGCFSADEAMRIANGNQRTDEATSKKPGRGWVVRDPLGLIDQSIPDYANQDKNITYHALHPGNHEPYLEMHWQNASQGASGNLSNLGTYLHYRQDMFSHEGYTNPSYGHLYGTHAADKTDSDVSKAQRMVAETWRTFNHFARQKRCGCQGKWSSDMWPVINEFLNTPGGNSFTRWRYSIEEINPSYLDNKRYLLGLPRRER